jgi:hypothetical protein
MIPADHGPSLDAVIEVVRAVRETGRLAATSIACTWHPDEVDPERCGEVITAVLDALD